MLRFFFLGLGVWLLMQTIWSLFMLKPQMKLFCRWMIYWPFGIGHISRVKTLFE